MRNQFIRMPENEDEISIAKARFYRIDQFPLVIGAIDGTHIRMESLGGNDAELYRNRKAYFSINAQMVVSADVSAFLTSLNKIEISYYEAVSMNGIDS